MSNASNFLNKYLWLFGFLFLFSLGQLQRIQLSNSIAIYAHEIFAIIWMMKNWNSYFSWLKCFVKKNVQKKNISLFTLIIFLILQLIFYNFFDFQLTQIVYYLRFIFYAILSIFLLFQQKTSQLTRKDFQLAIGFIGIFVAVLGIFQYLLIPDSRFLLYSGWDDHYYRLISTFFDPGFTSLVLVITYLALLSWQKKPSSFFFYFISPLFFLTILLTYSRAGYLSLLSGFIIYFINQFHKQTKKWKLFYTAISAIFFIGLIPFLPKPGGEGVNLLRTSSIEQRLESNQNALKNLDGKTFLVGSGFYRSIKSTNFIPNHATAPDNSFIFLFTSLGLAGSTLLIITTYQFKGAIFSHPTLLVVWTALIVNSMFNNSLFYVWNWVVMTMIAIGEGKRSTNKYI